MKLIVDRMDVYVAGMLNGGCRTGGLRRWKKQSTPESCTDYWSPERGAPEVVLRFIFKPETPDEVRVSALVMESFDAGTLCANRCLVFLATVHGSTNTWTGQVSGRCGIHISSLVL